MGLSAFDRWLTTEPEYQCPECGTALPDGPEDPDLPDEERHGCFPMDAEPVEVGDPGAFDY